MTTFNIIQSLNTKSKKYINVLNYAVLILIILRELSWIYSGETLFQSEILGNIIGSAIIILLGIIMYLNKI